MPLLAAVPQSWQCDQQAAACGVASSEFGAFLLADEEARDGVPQVQAQLQASEPLQQWTLAATQLLDCSHNLSSQAIKPVMESQKACLQITSVR